MKSIIFVSPKHINDNARDGTCLPVVTLLRGGVETLCHGVDILGPSRIVYNDKAPQRSGARVWIETDAEVVAYKTRNMTRNLPTENSNGNQTG